MANTKTERPIKYSYDWWFEKGEEDAKKRWEPKNWEPKHPKVKPYMAGWAVEVDDRRLGDGLEYHNY